MAFSVGSAASLLNTPSHQGAQAQRPPPLRDQAPVLDFVGARTAASHNEDESSDWQKGQMQGEDPSHALHDPRSLDKLLAISQLNTRKSAYLTRLSVLFLLGGAVFFDGTNWLAQAINIVCVILLCIIGHQCHHAACSATQVLERERDLRAVNGYIDAGVVGQFQQRNKVSAANASKTRERQAFEALEQAWSKIHGVKRYPGMTLAEAVSHIIKERDQAWQALNDEQNLQTRARTRPRLQVVSSNPKNIAPHQS